MRVCYIQINEEGLEEQVFHGDFNTRQEAHQSAVALADSLVGNENVFEVIRGFPVSETDANPLVSYNIPPTEKQRNPSGS